MPDPIGDGARVGPRRTNSDTRKCRRSRSRMCGTPAACCRRAHEWFSEIGVMGWPVCFVNMSSSLGTSQASRPCAYLRKPQHEMQLAVTCGWHSACAPCSIMCCCVALRIYEGERLVTPGVKLRGSMSDDPARNDESPIVTYASHVNVNVTVYDVALTFGIGSDSNVDEHVRVHMSPQHARSLHILLGRFLRQYEEQIGPIALPDELVATLDGKPASVPSGEDGDALS